MWERNPADLGTVIEVGYSGVKIQWNNGQFSNVHLNDMEKIERAPVIGRAN